MSCCLLLPSELLNHGCLQDPKTYMKIKFVPFDLDKGELASKLHGVLSEYFDPDTVEWLQEEMKENRDKAMVGQSMW